MRIEAKFTGSIKAGICKSTLGKEIRRRSSESLQQVNKVNSVNRALAYCLTGNQCLFAEGWLDSCRYVVEFKEFPWLSAPQAER